MRVSLNDLVSILAARAGQHWNTDLMEEMKVVINYKRADFFKKLIEQHPEQRRFFMKSFSVALQEVDKAECPVDTDCTILRTTVKIPLPVRSSYTFFDYVGSPDKTIPYNYALPEIASIYSRYNRFTSRLPSYYYSNGYIYVYNADDVEFIGISGIFSDPRELSPFKCEGAPCYSDDDVYDIPEDLINSIIRDILQVELRQQAATQGVVEVDTSDKETNQGGQTQNM